MTLGRLEPVDLRTVWNNEATDFTPWLAREENLALLADTLGLELELKSVEAPVGPFRAALVCRESLGESLVLIENQLECADHSHLGQLLTYAAGQGAVTIVWIARRFTDEHRAALDWLNDVTSDEINFFGLEIQLWKIGDSDPAPKFNIVSQPNDWTKRIRAVQRTGDLDPFREAQLAFWTSLHEKLKERNSPVRMRKPAPRNYMNFGAGRAGFSLAASTHSTKHQMNVQFWISPGGNQEAYYRLLNERREEIGQALGTQITWFDAWGFHFDHRAGVDPTDPNEWPAMQDWMIERLELLYRVMAPIVVKLNPADYFPEEMAFDDQ
jgi:hypothetical protein